MGTVPFTAPTYNLPMTTLPTTTLPAATLGTLPTTASMVAYPQLQTGPFTFYPASQAPATLPAPAGLNAPKLDTPKAPAKRDAKAAKKKTKGKKKCGCC